jgi:hypothetical protein
MWNKILRVKPNKRKWKLCTMIPRLQSNKLKVREEEDKSCVDIWTANLVYTTSSSMYCNWIYELIMQCEKKD